MDSQWPARAREIVTEKGYNPDFGSGPEWVATLTSAAAEAYQAGERKHVEHHRCERCHAAGVAEERARWIASTPRIPS